MRGTKIVITLCGKFQFDLSVAHPEESTDQMVGLKLKVSDQSCSSIWEASCIPLVNRATREDEGNFFSENKGKKVFIIA